MKFWVMQNELFLLNINYSGSCFSKYYKKAIYSKDFGKRSIFFQSFNELGGDAVFHNHIREL